MNTSTDVEQLDMFGGKAPEPPPPPPRAALDARFGLMLRAQWAHAFSDAAPEVRVTPDGGMIVRDERGRHLMVLRARDPQRWRAAIGDGEEGVRASGPVDADAARSVRVAMEMFLIGYLGEGGGR